MRDVENAAFARGISAEALMNQAGAGIAQAVQQFFPRPGYCFVFSGKGNNGGDALVAAARLKRAGWHTDVHLSFPEPQCSDLLRKKIEGLLIDKATYELAYELNNRPDWVTIPIRGILQLSRP